MKNQVGILGGGQLALMLANSAVSQGLIPVVFAENKFAPAALVHLNTIYGSINDEEALKTFLSQVNHVIFENEFVDCTLLRKVASQLGHVKFHPRLETIELLQDKIKQKQVLRDLQIPSANSIILDSKSSISEQLKAAHHQFRNGFVIKWARNGYDGRGVFLPRNFDSYQKYSTDAEAFCRNAIGTGNTLYLEERIAFRRELAVVAARSTTGDFAAYPLVVSEQKNGICWRVYGPAVELGVSEELEKQAHLYAQKLAETVQLEGVFALEFFETLEGDLRVNEIAPRVHNSGHYTQNACQTDQFENHWRAVLGLPLGEVKAVPSFAMLNILGPDSVFDSQQLPIPGPRSHLHWYGKREVRPGRKLGHLNGTVQSPGDLNSLLSELDHVYRIWCGPVCSGKDKN